MRLDILRNSCSFCIAVMMIIAGSSRAAEPTPLLANGDFSRLDAGGWPEGWPKSPDATWHADGGVHFLRLTSPAPGKTVMLYRRVMLPEPAPEALELRVRVRYDVDPGKTHWHDARVLMNFKDAGGRVLKPAPRVPDFHGKSADWVTRSTFMAVPKGAAYLEVMPALLMSDSGTFDLAEADVFPASIEQVPKPPPHVPSATLPPPDAAGVPPELHVVGNQLRTTAGTTVILQGLCLDSLEWSAKGEHLSDSIPVAIGQWHANVIRLPIGEKFWWGAGGYQKRDPHGLDYRQTVDNCVHEVTRRGAYLVLDLHRFGTPNAEDVAFWRDAATRYKNNPAVVFELFNEPHDISWNVWKQGGSVADESHRDAHAAENSLPVDDDSVGMQALVDAVRGTGARNLIVAGGIDWGYDLSGLLKGYALRDAAGADGVMYSSHIYPWKKDWQHYVLDAAAKYPVFVGEVGCPQKWEDFKFIPLDQRLEKLGPGCTWPVDMIGMIQKYKLNWTGFSFHPKCGPMVITDWNYTPTDYWGVYVKDALAGKTFQVRRMR